MNKTDYIRVFAIEIYKGISKSCSGSFRDERANISNDENYNVEENKI